MGRYACYAAVALLLLGGAVLPVSAQQQETTHPGTELNPAKVPDLHLTAAQKQTIYSSISNQKQKETAPATFQPQVGAVVPGSIELQQLPKTLVDLVPELKNYEYAMVTNQVLLVDPKSKQVVEIIN
jgi:hypothetical protein